MIFALRPTELLPQERDLFDRFSAALMREDFPAAQLLQSELCTLVRARGYTAYEMPDEYLRLNARMQQLTTRLAQIQGMVERQGMDWFSTVDSSAMADGDEFPPELQEMLVRQNAELEPLIAEQSGLMRELMQLGRQLEPLMQAAGVDQQKLAAEATPWEYPEEYNENNSLISEAMERGDHSAVQRLMQRNRDIEAGMGIVNLGSIIE